MDIKAEWITFMNKSGLINLIKIFQTNSELFLNNLNCQQVFRCNQKCCGWEMICKKVDSKKSKDFYIFRCSKCSTSLTIRTGSILHKFKFSLPKFVKLLHYWAMRTTIPNKLAYQNCIEIPFKLFSNTCGSIFAKYFREKTSCWAVKIWQSGLMNHYSCA